MKYLITLIAAVMFAPAALACSCVCPQNLTAREFQSHVEERVLAADVVFSGEVTAIEWPETPEGEEFRFANVTFETDSVIRGDVADEITITYFFSSVQNLCQPLDLTFATGDHIEVFAAMRTEHTFSRDPAAAQLFTPATLFAQTGGCDCFRSYAFRPSIRQPRARRFPGYRW